jgi:hypothetical protein
VRTNPNPTFFQTGSARKPYNRGQWGSVLRATPQATMSDVTNGRGLQNLYVHVPTVSSLAGLADRLVTSVIIGLGLTLAIRNKGLGTGQQVCRREPGKVDLL